MDKENLKINFKNNGKKMEFDPLKIIENENNETFPIPEMMKGDRKKMEIFMNKGAKL